MLGGLVPFSPATASLCLAAITHTYLLFHCFPYIGYMSVQLHGNDFKWEEELTVDNVGWYAGLLGTAFTTGRCISFVPWKKLRHRYSVKKSLLLSLFLSTLCSLWFGMSRTFTSALVARFCLGLSNTLSGCVKRIAIDREIKAASKRASGDHSQYEEMAPARVLAVMWWGSAIGPLLGGILANPGTFKTDSLLPDKLEEWYPYLLPNLVAAFLCILSMITVAIFISDEDEAKPAPTHTTNVPVGEGSPLLHSSEQKRKSIQANDSIAAKFEAMKTYWKSRNTRNHLVAYWTFSFVVVCIDEALPLFLIARLAGPGLSPRLIGWILSVAGFIVVISQSLAAERVLTEEQHLRFYPSLRVASVLGNVPSVFVPVMIALNGGTYFYLASINAEEGDNQKVQIAEEEGQPVLGEAGTLTWTSFLFLVLLTGMLRAFCSIYFSLIGVATGRTVPLAHKDNIARIMTLGALCARAVAPVVAGILVSVFMASSSLDGAAAWGLWAVIGLVFGLGAAALSLPLKEAAQGADTGQGNVRSKRQSLYLDNRQRAQVFVKLWDVHYDQGSTTVGAKWRRLARKAITYNRLRSPSSKKSDVTEEEADDETGNITKSSHKRTSWFDHVLRPGLDPYQVPFFILGTSKNDKACMPHVLTPPLMDSLHKHLPMVCSEDNFWLKFSLIRDGSSITALETKIVGSKNTFIAIETLQGDIFGCFMTKPWERTNKYEMSGESFLWRMTSQRSIDTPADQSEEALDEIARRESDIDVYPWTGESDDCQLLSADRIAAGGGMVDGKDGFGFIIEDGLANGSSSPCLTYGNPSLVSSPDGRFEVANMEVWAMTPFLIATEAAKSEQTIRFIRGNMINPQGDAPSSAQSAWTSFL